jgi:hypothetical protein
MSKIQNGKCFDSDLNQVEDLDFYLMSSKDNIIIELNDKFYCYKRKELLHQLVKEDKIYYGKVYYYLKDFNLFIDKQSHTSLKNREHRFYSLNFVKSYNIGDVYSFESVNFKNIKNF